MKNETTAVFETKLKYINAMYSVKPLPVVPGFNAVTVGMAAEYFEVPRQTIQNALSRNSELFMKHGSKKYEKSDFEHSDYDEVSPVIEGGVRQYRYGEVSVIVGNPGVRMLPPEAVFLMALFLRCPVAEQIRQRTAELETAESANENVPKEPPRTLFDDPTPVYHHESESSSNLKIFDNPNFGTVRTIVINDEPWLVGKDVTGILGYTNSSDAISKHVFDEDKGVAKCDTLGGNQKMTIINESGLYSLVLSSKLPTARQFRRWITSEVIPSIRKHGAYMTPDTIEKVLSDPDTIIRLATDLKNERLKTQSLSAANAALTMEANTWDDRSVINALVRAFGSSRCDGDFVKAWNVFYKKFNYANHTNVRVRRPENSRKRLIEFIHPDEIKSALRVAAAMCEEAGIPTGDVINQANRKRIGI